MKPQILVVQPSLTMLYLLQGAFRSSDFATEGFSQFDLALQRLSGLKEESDEFPKAVLIDWPLYPTTPSDELLTLLERSDFRHLPVVVISQEARADARAWVAQRPNTTFVLWESHQQVRPLVEGLLQQGQGLVKESFNSKFANEDIHILVVDDSPSVRVSLRKLLTLQGYQVEVCATGDDAFQAAQSGNFDIAVIDFYLGEETGDEVCRRIMTHEASRSTICTILTGTYSDALIRKCLRAGAVECMFKDESSELLLARLDAISRVVRAQKSLRRDRRRLDAILGSVHDGVYGVNQRGELTFINNTARKLLGYRSEESLLGRSAHELFHHSDSRQRFIHIDSCQIQYAYEHGVEIEDMDGTFFDSNNRPLAITYSIRPLRVDGKEMGSIVIFSAREERRGLEDQVWERLAFDQLTGLMNRRYFESCLQNELHRVRRDDSMVSLMVLNVVFRTQSGQPIDEVAQAEMLHLVANILSARFRNTDYLGYLGKGSYALLLAGASEEFASFIVGRLMEEIGQRVSAGNSYEAECSGGLVTLSDEFSNSGELLNMAQLAVQMAKRKGSNYLYSCGSQQFIPGSAAGGKVDRSKLQKSWRRVH